MERKKVERKIRTEFTYGLKVSFKRCYESNIFVRCVFTTLMRFLDADAEVVLNVLQRES